MEIKIINNDDIENIKDILLKNNSQEERKYFLYRDKKTKFEKFKDNQYEDIKNVILIIDFKESNSLVLKGNLSLKACLKGQKLIWDIEFYPYFKIEKINKFLNNDYNIKIFNEINNETLEESYKNLLEEFQKEEYLAPFETKEFKEFMKPYEYYVSLKKKMIEKDFFVFEDFEKEPKKVIKLTSKDKNYKLLNDDEYFIFKQSNKVEDSIFIDYNRNKYLFSNKINKDNIFLFLEKTVVVSLENFKKETEKLENLRKKFKNKINKKTFYAIDKISKNRLIDKNKKIVNLLKDEKQEISVENIEFTELVKKEKSVLFKKETLKIFFESLYILSDKDRNIEKIKIMLNDFLNAWKSLLDETTNFIERIEISSDEVIQEDENNFEIFKTLKLFLKSKKEENDDLINAFDLEIKKNIKILEKTKEEFKIEEDNNAQKINAIKLKVKELSKEEENFKRNISNSKNKNNKKEQNKNNDTILNLKKKIIFKNEELNLLEKKIESNLQKLNDKLNSINKNFFINEEKLITQIKKLKIELKEYFINNGWIEEESKRIKNGIRLIKFEYNILIFYKYKEKINPKYKQFWKNIFTLNGGDIVLVNTIESINKDIKDNVHQNNDFLLQVIGKRDIDKFDDQKFNENFDENVIPTILNNSQKDAFKRAISLSERITIIQGPPGTGKTEVITEIIKYYHSVNEKVILSSQTNVAIRNVLDKLTDFEKTENSIVSLWLTTNQEKESNSIQNIEETWNKKIMNNLNKHSLSKIKEIYQEMKNENVWKKLTDDENLFSSFSLEDETKVVAATTTTSFTMNGKKGKKFLKNVSVLIMDEVSKSILPEILRYGMDVKKIILVGDSKQLSPIMDINKNDFKEGEIDQEKFSSLKEEITSSIFTSLNKRAEKSNASVTLDVNYRSLPGVLNTYQLFYDKLTPHREFHEFSKEYKFNNNKIFDNEHNVYFINIEDSEEISVGTSRKNQREVEEMIWVLENLSKSLEVTENKSIAIIFPYAAQINLFQNKISKKLQEFRSKFKSIKLDTVDSFQGSEANIVFLSTVVTNLNNRTFLTDARRINVSLSRAKDMLIIFGKKSILTKLEISSDSVIAKDKYFDKILNEKLNPFLKEIKVRKEKT